ncbi:MAG: DUF2064 domain-containing protein [Flavobacteriaceae bacterium]
MKMNPKGYSNTAILIFANSPEEESRRKSLLCGGELFRDIMARTSTAVKKTGLPYFHIDEHHQRGANFENRFLNAMEDVLEKGYEYIIAIGADTPRISSRQILTAAEELHKGQIVIGPSTDGGFYLIGLHKSQFLRQEMLRLPWQKSGLTTHLIARLKYKGLKICTLRVLSDIDEPGDLKRLALGYKNIPYSIFNYFRLAFKREIRPVSYFERHFDPIILQSHYNKGSPLSGLFTS